MIENGFKSFNAKQIWQWIYNKHEFEFDQMTNLSKNLREMLSENCNVLPLEIVDVKNTSSKTQKYLFKSNSGDLIETVLMKHDYGNTVCVSSQVGCDIGCSICASGIDGCVRDLTASEMVAQVLIIDKQLSLNSERVKNIVVMGMGEPFLNFDELEKFIRIVNDEHGLNIGARHITVSTSGIIPGIKRFEELGLQVKLAISLHAARDEVRNIIVPINRKYNIDKLVEACKAYTEKTNRRVMFEYVMINKINDSLNDARILANLLRGMNCIVNLIPLNEIDENDYKRSRKEQVEEFSHILLNAGINTTIRREFGNNIDAACGQLRRRKIK